MKKTYFNNPIIKGSYPDPSICRVDGTYYIVTSSFSYFPGLPVFRSKDLVHWEQIANAISRPEQLDYRNCDISEGLWAPTIRYSKGIFYIVDTLAVNGRAEKYNFIITATDPAGEWSNAVIIDGADGIDPSLYFADDGKLWFCANMLPEKLKYPSHKLIYLCQLDSQTFQFIGERHMIYDGSLEYNSYMEAPHIYFRNGWHYLLITCGGTQTNHAVHIARSKKITGTYETCERNPILTNRNLPLVNQIGVSVVGHGDLIQIADDDWYMVLLGVRPYEYEIDDYSKFEPRKWMREPDRSINAQYSLGREVFLIPIAWDYDGWPVINNKNGLVNLKEKFPNTDYDRPPLQSRIDNFEDETLSVFWCMRRPTEDKFYSLGARKSYMRLKLLATKLEDLETPAMLVRRQQHYHFQASTAMEFDPNDGEEAGLVIEQNNEFAFLIVKTRKNNTNYLCCYQVVNGVRQLLASKEVKTKREYLCMEGNERMYSFYYGEAENRLTDLVKAVNGSILSTVVADGYNGTYMGLYASSNSIKSNNYVDFDWFKYEIIED